jgi:hypothetical protein
MVQPVDQPTAEHKNHGHLPISAHHNPHRRQHKNILLRRVHRILPKQRPTLLRLVQPHHKRSRNRRRQQQLRTDGEPIRAEQRLGQLPTNGGSAVAADRKLKGRNREQHLGGDWHTVGVLWL